MATQLQVSEWLSRAAAPVCLGMAWVAAGGHGTICVSTPGPWPLNDMATMYLLMSVFHLPAWLRPWRGKTITPIPLKKEKCQ
ncbi:hypothetical protein [Paracoccus ravus]|uniref:hypothetical protein n=1 Tax=Paracoccus ravus TaxID=2447760 RepID=UPI001ADBF764|nr:hypothetical protein [Paracoccus ravus]